VNAKAKANSLLEICFERFSIYVVSSHVVSESIAFDDCFKPISNCSDLLLSDLTGTISAVVRPILAADCASHNRLLNVEPYHASDLSIYKRLVDK
jgi:hypothetical protein